MSASKTNPIFRNPSKSDLGLIPRNSITVSIRDFFELRLLGHSAYFA